MANPVLIKGVGGNVADVCKYSESGKKTQALEVATRESNQYSATSIFFTNDTYGPNLNQDATSSGTPDGIYNGGDTALWTPTALSGTWDFVSTFSASDWPVDGTQSVDATATTNGNQALFTRGSTIDADNYTSVSGWVYLTTFDALRHEILIFFRLAGVPVGVSIDLTDFVNENELNVAQKFSIPLSTLGVTGNVDELVIQTVRTTGNQPNYYLDKIQLEEGGSLVYSVTPREGTVYQFDVVEFLIVDALDTTLLNSSMPNLSYNKILALPELEGGLAFRVITDGVPRATLNFKNLADFLDASFSVVDQGCDGTNTFIKLRGSLSEFVTLRAESRDKAEVTISDDLSGLIRFRANVRGRVLV